MYHRISYNRNACYERFIKACLTTKTIKGWRHRKTDGAGSNNDAMK